MSEARPQEMLAETNPAIEPNDPFFSWLLARDLEPSSSSLSHALSLSDWPLEDPCPSEHTLPISSKGGKYETESVAGRRDGETGEMAFERTELPCVLGTGDPALVDDRDGRARNEECRERGVDMGGAELVVGREGMEERDEDWR